MGAKHLLNSFPVGQSRHGKTWENYDITAHWEKIEKQHTHSSRCRSQRCRGKTQRMQSRRKSCLLCSCCQSSGPEKHELLEATTRPICTILRTQWHHFPYLGKGNWKTENPRLKVLRSLERITPTLPLATLVKNKDAELKETCSSKCWHMLTVPWPPGLTTAVRWTQDQVPSRLSSTISIAIAICL